MKMKSLLRISLALTIALVLLTVLTALLHYIGEILFKTSLAFILILVIVLLVNLLYKRKQHRVLNTLLFFSNRCIGGDERVRTSAPLSRPNCLANSPLHHLGTSPFINKS